MIEGWAGDPGGQEKYFGPQGLRSSSSLKGWLTRVAWCRGLLLLLIFLLPCRPQASPTRCSPPLPALLRLNGQPYLETRNKELMIKKEVGEVVANVQLLLSPFLSSLSCKLVKDQENQYSYFGVRQVFSAKTLSQGEECQVYYARTGLPTSWVNLTLLVEASQTGDLPTNCAPQTQTQVLLQIQFCSRRDYDICGLDPPEEPRASNGGEFDEFPVGPPAVLQPEFPILEPDFPSEVITKTPATVRPDLFTKQPQDGSDEEWEGEFQPVLEEFPESDSEWDEDEARGFQTEEPGLESEQEVVAVPVKGEEEEEEMENGQTGDALIDKIRVALFSTNTAPITIAVLSFLLASSLLGLACLYCRGRQRDRKLRQLRSFLSRSPSTSSSSTASTISSATEEKSKTPSSEKSTPKKKGAQISPNNLPKITLPLSRQPRLFDDNMVMYFQEVEPLGEDSSGVVKHPRTLVTRRSWTAAQED